MYQAPPPVNPLNPSGPPNVRSPGPSWRHIGCLLLMLAPLLVAIVLAIFLG
ncbi:MAG TPA: hypothetical protein VGE07_25370 [Herpetosiphonaceae bacterium]